MLAVTLINYRMYLPIFVFTHMYAFCRTNIYTCKTSCTLIVTTNINHIISIIIFQYYNMMTDINATSIGI